MSNFDRLEKLIYILKTHNNPEVRIKACNILKDEISELSDIIDDCITVLLNIASQDSDKDVRFIAKKVAEIIKARFIPKNINLDPEKKVKKQLNINALKRYLESSNPDIRLKTVLKTKDYENDAVLPILKEHLKTETHLYVIAALCKMIGYFGTEKELELLEPYLNHEDSRVRANALEGISFINSSKKFIYLSKAMNDSDDRVKATATTLMENADPRDKFNVAKELAGSNSIASKQTAIFLLKSIDIPETEELIIKLLKDECQEIKLDVITLIAEKGSDKSVVPLINFLKEDAQGPQINVGKSTLKKLMKRVSQENVQKINEYFDSIEEEPEAIKTIYVKSQPKTRTTLELFVDLNNPDENVKIAAIKELAKKTHSLTVKERLESYLKKAKGKVREALIEALKNFEKERNRRTISKLTRTSISRKKIFD